MSPVHSTGALASISIMRVFGAWDGVFWAGTWIGEERIHRDRVVCVDGGRMVSTTGVYYPTLRPVDTLFRRVVSSDRLVMRGESMHMAHDALRNVISWARRDMDPVLFLQLRQFADDLDRKVRSTQFDDPRELLEYDALVLEPEH